MRRNLFLPIAVLVGAAVATPISLAVAAPLSTTPDSSPVGVGAERFGVVRYDLRAHRWTIQSDATVRGFGLTGVSCSPRTGVLTVSFTPLSSIGTFTVDEDDAYAGRFAAGAAASTGSLAVTFRRVGGGVASCDAAGLRIPGSSLQIFVRGTQVVTSPPTDSVPLPPPPADPGGTPPPASMPPVPSDDVPAPVDGPSPIPILQDEYDDGK